MQARINGLRVLEGELYEPRVGAWTAVLEVDASDKPGDAGLSGPVTLTLGDETFLGTITAGADEGGRLKLTVVGGAGGLQRELDARYYYQTSAEVVLGDILRATGETLDARESDPVVVTALLARWSRSKGQARQALSQLVEDLGAYWRVGRTGAIIVKKDETWDAPDGVLVETDKNPSTGRAEVAPEERPVVRPGTTLSGGERVLEVTTRFDDTSVRQEVLYDVDGSGKMRGLVHAQADAARRAVETPLLYAQWYPARVVSQDKDGTVQLVADDPRIRGNGITHVPIRHGVPGLVVKVALNERVILFFENGDPKKPACALWPDGSSVREVYLTAQTKLVFEAPEMLYGDRSASHPMALGDLLDKLLRTLSVSTAMGPSGPPITTDPVWQQYLSTKHKVDG